MAKTCRDCGDESSDVRAVKIGRSKILLCEDCADVRREEAEVAEEAESAMQDMMEYKGR